MAEPQPDMHKPIRILVVEDEPIFRLGLQIALEPFADQVEAIGEAANAEEAVALARRDAPDLVLLDLRLPERSGLGSPSLEQGIRVIEQVAALSRPPRVLVLSYLKDADAVFLALKAGAHGYIAKDDRFHGKELVESIQRLMGGEAIYGPAVADLIRRFFAGSDRSDIPAVEKLTQRRQVLGLLARNEANREIEEALIISTSTVKTHVSSILAKLHLRSRHEVPLYRALRRKRTGQRSKAHCRYRSVAIRAVAALRRAYSHGPARIARVAADIVAPVCAPACRPSTRRSARRRVRRLPSRHRAATRCGTGVPLTFTCQPETHRAGSAPRPVSPSLPRRQRRVRGCSCRTSPSPDRTQAALARRMKNLPPNTDR